MIPASRFRTVARPVPFVAAVVLFSGLAADAAKEHASPGKPATNAPVTTEGVIAAIEKYVHRKFEDPQGLKVRLVPYESPEALQRGMFREVQITMDRAIFDGIAMRDMFMGGRDVVIDLNALLGRNSLRTSQREHGAIRATITEDGLNKAFEAVKMPIRQFHMTFVDGGVVATGVYKFIVGNRLRMKATLEPRDDGVWFICQSASVNGLALPAGQVRALLNKINPIVDFTELPFSPRPDRIVVDGKKRLLTVLGGNVPEKPKPKPRQTGKRKASR